MAIVKLIEYEAASPEVRAVYDDIMATRQIDWINNFWKALAVQMHHSHKGLDVALDGRDAVMGVQSNLVVGFALQPPPDDLGFVSLPTPNAMQFAPGGQIDLLGLQIGKISLDGAERNVQGPRQVFLGRHGALAKGFTQQTLNANVPQGYSAMTLQDLLVFGSHVHSP